MQRKAGITGTLSVNQMGFGRGRKGGMLQCSAMPMLHGWQRPVVDLGNNKEESRACNFQQSFSLCQASSDAC